MSRILVSSAEELTRDSNTLDQMYRFRYKIFYERLGWEVSCNNGREHDFYDELNPVYMVAKNSQQEIEGCWRLLPTTGPYMLKDSFPQLLGGHSAPQDRRIWELSRFAVSPTEDKNDENLQVAFNGLTCAMMRRVVDFAEQNLIERYITVTSAALERMLIRMGIPIYRFENLKPQRIGKVRTVACWIDINSQTRAAVDMNYHVNGITRVAA